MGKRRVLVQWIGHTDIRAMAVGQSAAKQGEIMAAVKGQLLDKGELGPIKTLIRKESFDEVRLLSNYPADWNNRFLSWLGSKAEVVKVELKKPTDYGAIFKIADTELAAIRERKHWPNTELCLHLSPGTPAMAAVWLLLGKTRYPATFYETFPGKSWVAWGEYEGEGRSVQQMSYYPLTAYFVDDDLVVAITNHARTEIQTCYHEHFSRAHGVEPPAGCSLAQKQLRYKQKLTWDELGGMIRNLKRIKNV